MGGDIEWVRPRFCRSFRIQLLTRDIDTLRGIYTYTQQRWHWMSKKTSVFRLARELHRLIKQTSLQQWRIYRQPTHHKICIGKHPICVYVSWHVKICKQESECFGENMKHDSISNFCIQQLCTLVGLSFVLVSRPKLVLLVGSNISRQPSVVKQTRQVGWAWVGGWGCGGTLSSSWILIDGC